jgi:hypothetical protein
MNAATARHLSMLLARSKPIIRDGDKWHHSSLSWDYIRDIIKPIETANDAAAQAEEIRAAARERRDCSHFACGIGHSSPNMVEWHQYGGYSRILLGLCSDQIDAAIAADNARRLAEYEAYRAACEQGVAVPPEAK